MTTIYLSLGSNIGNRKKNLEKAVAELNKNNIKEIKISSLYETEPVGPKQRNFYNIAGKFKTNLNPRELKQSICSCTDERNCFEFCSSDTTQNNKNFK